LKIVCILGKTCSGKTTLERTLEKMGFKRLISYTTKTPRLGEVDGVDYRFVTHEQFQELMKNEVLVEWAQHAGKYYGSPIPVGGDKFVVVVNPEGYRQFKEVYKDQVFGVYLNVDAEEAFKRNSRTAEVRLDMDRRAVEEKEQFKEIESKVNLVLDSASPIGVQVAEIIKHSRV